MANLRFRTIVFVLALFISVLTACVNPLWLIPKSSDAVLSALTLSAGSLDPRFDGSRTSFTTRVSYDVSSVSVTATAHNANATISINGTAVSSGVASSPISLTPTQAASISIVVTAENGTTTKTYTVSVTRAISPASDASLSALTMSAGYFLQHFSPDVLLYSAEVLYSSSSTTVTPTTTSPTAVITVNGAAAVSGSASAAIDLVAGQTTTVTIVVTSEDGTASKTYSIRIVRNGADWKDITRFTFPMSLNPGLIDSFAGTIDSVAHTVTIGVADGTPITSLVPSIDMNGISISPTSGQAQDFTAPVSYAVTAADNSTQTYTVTVTSLPLATITGTLTIPIANANNMDVWITLEDVDLNSPPPSNIVWGTGTSETFSIPNVPAGIYYLRICIDRDSNGAYSQGDYMGTYGSSALLPPQSPNLVVPYTGIVAVNIPLISCPATTTMSGTVTIPAGIADGKELYIVIAWHDPFSIGGLVTYTGMAWTGAGITHNYSISGLIPGTFYAWAWVDMDGDGNFASGDFVGYYGGTGHNAPAAPNLTVTAGQPLVGIDITTAELP